MTIRHKVVRARHLEPEHKCGGRRSHARKFPEDTDETDGRRSGALGERGIWRPHPLARARLKTPRAPADSVGMVSRLALAAVASIAALSAAGCGGAPGQVPESASLAPADAVLFARVTTASESPQWTKAETVLERIPGVRDGIVSAIRQELASESLDWEDDIAPALGDEVVVVVTASLRPVVLLRPESTDKLVALLARSDDDLVRGEVGDHVALAERESDLGEYRAALERGTIEADEGFVAGLDALPDESLGLVWVDMSVLTKELTPLLEQATQGDPVDFGIEWLSAAVSAEENGMLVAIGARVPGAGDTQYEPELFGRVPADAVAAFSFGGTQGTLDRVQGRVDVDELSKTFEKLTGVSLDGVVEALSGEGVLYVRPGDSIPDVTLALAPPDPAETWSTVDRLARELAAQAQAEVQTTIENGVEVSVLEAEGVTIRYARLDPETIVVTTGDSALTLLTAGGPKLVDSDGYLRAAEELGLEGRTKGFLYVDVDGMLPMLERLAGESVPAEVREGFEAVDSILFRASGDGDSTLVSGFVRVP